VYFRVTGWAGNIHANTSKNRAAKRGLIGIIVLLDQPVNEEVRQPSSSRPDKVGEAADAGDEGECALHGCVGQRRT
jgi:hypothetical protein